MATEAARAMEAILMVSDSPLDPQLLAQVLEMDVSAVEATLQELMASYEVEDRGFILTKVAGGYRYQSHPDLAPYVERFVLEGQNARMSAAALETLAIIAYKQPISRGQVSAIRGVNVDGVVRTLEQRGYIMEVGRDPGPGNPSLFGTTTVFLEKLGLNSVDELPPIADLVPGPEVVEQLEQGLRAEIDEDLATQLVGTDTEASPFPEADEPIEVSEPESDPDEPVEVGPPARDPEGPVEANDERDALIDLTEPASAEPVIDLTTPAIDLTAVDKAPDAGSPPDVGEPQHHRAPDPPAGAAATDQSGTATATETPRTTPVLVRTEGFAWEPVTETEIEMLPRRSPRFEPHGRVQPTGEQEIAEPAEEAKILPFGSAPSLPDPSAPPHPRLWQRIKAAFVRSQPVLADQPASPPPAPSPSPAPTRAASPRRTSGTRAPRPRTSRPGNTPPRPKTVRSSRPPRTPSAHQEPAAAPTSMSRWQRLWAKLRGRG